MHNLDFGTVRVASSLHPALISKEIELPLWHFVTSIEFKKQDENSYEIPEGEEALRDWWNRFNQAHKYPLYCLILATSVDESIATLIDRHRQELAEIAGDECCIIYFRDLNKAKLLEPFQFTEHAKGVKKFIKIIGVQQDQLPCILFFQKITTGKFVLVDVEHKTHTEAIQFFRGLFAFIYSQPKVSLKAVEAFKRTKKAKAIGGVFMNNIKQLSKEIVTELVKSLTTLP